MRAFGSCVPMVARASRARADFPSFDKWYRKTHKKVYPITVTGMPAEEEAEIQSEAEKVSEVFVI